MSTSKKRDEFPASVRRALMERVGGLCSNPDCPKVTLGPKASDKNKSLKRGRAAHIYAAAPGGPRYNPNMTPSERKSINNAIWLCIDCADKIDTDEKKYPADLLNAWKRKTEAKAAFLLENPPINHNTILPSVAMLVGGNTYTHPLDIPSMVKKLCEEKLEAIDPRWKVQLDLIGTGQRYTLEPSSSPINMTLKYKSKYKKNIKDTNDAILSIRDYGGVCEMKNCEFSLDGSPLLDFLLRDASIHSVVMKNEKNIPCRVEVLDDSNVSTIFAFDAKGVFSHGERGFKFSISAWDEILTAQWFIDHDEEQFINGKNTASIPCKINFNIEKWDSINIRDIQYFFEVFNFCKIVDKKRKFRFTFYADEPQKKHAFHFDMGVTHDKYFLTFLTYLDNARTLVNYLNIELPLKLGLGFSGDEFSELESLAEIAKNGFAEYKFAEINPKISATFDIIEGNIELLKTFKVDPQETSIAFSEANDQTIVIFNKKITIPQKRREFTKVIPKIRTALKKIIIGEKLSVRFLPSKKCKIKVYFADYD